MALSESTKPVYRHLIYIAAAIVATLFILNSVAVTSSIGLARAAWMSAIFYTLTAAVDLAIGRLHKEDNGAGLMLYKMPNNIVLLSLVSRPNAGTKDIHPEHELGVPTRFTRLPVRSILAKQSEGDRHQIMVSFHRTKPGSYRNLCVNGNQQDIQWLCAQFAQWSGLPNSAR